MKRDNALLEQRARLCSLLLVLLLNEPILLTDHVGASPGDCPLQGCPGFGVSRRPGANPRCRDLEVAPLSLGFRPVWAIDARVCSVAREVGVCWRDLICRT